MPEAEVLQETGGIDFVPEDTERLPETSWYGTLAREAGMAALPAIGSAAGAKGGFAGVGLLTANPIAGLAGAAGGALAGGVATDIAQQAVLNAVAPEFAERLELLRAAGREQHPYAGAIGRFIAALGTFSYAPGVTATGIRALPAIAKGTATEAEKAAAASAATQIGTGPATTIIGTPIVSKITEGEARLPTPMEIGESLLQNALLGQARIPALRISGPVIPTKPIAKEPTTAVPAQEPKLGFMRDAVQDPSLRVLSETEFNAIYRKTKTAVDRLENKLDEGTLTLAERWELAKAQDAWTASELERYRRDITDIVPSDLFRSLRKIASEAARFGKGSEAFQKASLLINELRRQGANINDLLADVQLRSPDEAEVFRGVLEDIQKLTSKEPTPAAPAPEPVTVPPAETVTGETKPTAGEATPAEPSASSKSIPLEPVMPIEGKSVGPGAASPVEFIERKTLDFQTSELLPDFIDRAKEREIFSQPYGAGRIPILGRAIDPNASVKTPEQQGLAAYAAARYGVGPARASYIGSRFGPEVKGAFQADANGDLNVGLTARSPEQSLKESDVMEGLQRDPDSYVLNPEQRRVWNEVLKPILDAKRKLVQKYDLTGTVDENGDPIAHFHRIVTEFPEGKEPLIRRIGQAVGGRIPSQRGRTFVRSEKQGWERGYKYEPDLIKRLVTDIERTYKAIADKRLINDEVFGGTTKKHLENQLRELYAEELASGEMTERSFKAILDNRMSAGQVFQPGFSGKVFTPETAKLLNDTLQAGDAAWRRTVQTANDFVRASLLGFDLGVGQLQLLPTFRRNPEIWADANWRSIQAIFKPDSFAEFLKQHDIAARELAEAGSSVGELQEFMAGLKPGALITRIPGGVVPGAIGATIGGAVAGPPGALAGGAIGAIGVGRLSKAFGRQYQTALDVAKIHLWEAWRKVTPPEERLAVIRTIESQLGIGRMESIGVSPNRALLERLTLLATSYYRGGVNYIAALAEPGVSGRIALQGIAAYIGAGVAIFYGIGKLIGMSDDQIKKRLDPTRPDYEQWILEGSNGRKINLGIGGIHRSLIRLVGNMIATSIKHPENWKSLATDKNPVSRWLRGHGAPLPQLAFTAFSGRDFIGEEADIGTILGMPLPLTAQQLIRREGEPPVTVKELAASFLGANAYPEAQSKQYVREREQLAEKNYGKAYETLPVREQLTISKILLNRAPFNTKVPATDRQIAQAFKNDVERRQRIAAGLTPEIREGLRQTGTHITGYEPSLKFGQQTLLLTENQQQRYEQLIIEDYNRALSRLPFKRLERLELVQRQNLLNKLMIEAKQRARARLIAEQARPTK